MKNFNKIILSLGSNIGDKKSNLETAINEINKFSTIKKVSSIYQSDPILLMTILPNLVALSYSSHIKKTASS